MKKSLVMIIILVLLFVSLKADIFIREEREISLYSGQPPEKMIIDTWLGEKKLTSFIKSGAVIFDLNINKVFIIEFISKTYFEADLPLDMSKFIPDARSKAMLGMMKNAPISIAPNGKTKKIGKWNCKGYNVKMKAMGVEMDITYWASTEVPFNWEKYSKLLEEYDKLKMCSDEESLNQLKKIKGYRIASEIAMMGYKAHIKVLEISIKDAPPGTYTIPKNFSKVEKMATPSRL